MDGEGLVAVRNHLKEPDVIALQEVAVFPDGANALPGLAQALGNYTPYIATNNDGRGIAPGFLVKNGTTASNGEVIVSGDKVWWRNPVLLGTIAVVLAIALYIPVW